MDRYSTKELQENNRNNELGKGNEVFAKYLVKV